MDLLRRTFGADSWRRAGYAAVSAPVGLAALALIAAGRPGRAAALQRAAVARLLGLPPADPSPGAAGRWTGPVGTVGYAVLSVPLGLLGLWLVAMLVPNTVRNLAYGLLVDDPGAAWGGPSRAGAWAVHAAGALALVPVLLWLVRGLTGLQRRLAGALLGGGRLSVGVGVGAAVGAVAAVVAGGLFLAAWAGQV